jgi:MFS family permease
MANRHGDANQLNRDLTFRAAVPSHWYAKHNRLLGVLLIAPFMAQVDVTIASVATPAIHNGLHASGAQVQLVIGGYMISFAMLLITGASSARRTATDAPSWPGWPCSRWRRSVAGWRPSSRP